jgi:hypothetical protein
MTIFTGLFSSCKKRRISRRIEDVGIAWEVVDLLSGGSLFEFSPLHISIYPDSISLFFGHTTKMPLISPS